MTTQQSKAKTQSGQELQNSKNLKTYSDFKKTLSEDERENFLEFVRGQIQNLERPINDLEAWLASKNTAELNRWEVYYKNYQDQKDGQKSRNAQKTSRQGNFGADENSAIARWQKRLKEQQAAAEAALRKSHPSFQQTNLAAEPENSPSDGVNDSEGAATDPSNETSPDDLKSAFDQILGNSAGFTKNTSPTPPPEETPPSPKITKEEGLNFLRTLGMVEDFDLDLNQNREEKRDIDPEQERDFWQDTDSEQDRDSDMGGEADE